MRYKVAPPTRSLDDLARARAAIPLVPDDEGDCCRAIQRATAVDDREEARAYLTFLRALGLVAETGRGYHRTRDPVERDRLAKTYRERVFLVDELLAAVEREPRTVDAAFAEVRGAVPRWERQRDTDWERHWRERVGHLLAWGVVFGCLTVESGRFTPAQ